MAKAKQRLNNTWLWSEAAYLHFYSAQIQHPRCEFPLHQLRSLALFKHRIYPSVHDSQSPEPRDRRIRERDRKKMAYGELQARHGA